MPPTSSSIDWRRRRHDHVGRERAVRVRGRQAVAGRAAARRGPPSGRRTARSQQTPASSRSSRCFGTPSASKPIGRPAGSRAVVGDRHQRRPDALAALVERAVLLDRERREAEVAQHVEDVDDRVRREHDRIVAGLDSSTGLTLARASSAASRPIACGVDRGRVDRDTAPRSRSPCRDPSSRSAAGYEVRRSARAMPFVLATATRLRVRARTSRRPSRPPRRRRRSPRGHPRRAAPGWRWPCRSDQASGSGSGAVGLGRPGPVLELVDVGRDRRGPLDERAHALVVHAPGARDAHPAALARTAG